MFFATGGPLDLTGVSKQKTHSSSKKQDMVTWFFQFKKNRLIICFGHGERTLVSGYLQLSVFISQLVTYLQLALERGGSVIVACVFV